MNLHGDFDQNMSQLIQLLKKILMNHIPQGQQFQELQSLFKDHSINLNLCFFTFLPMTPQELDEFEEIYERYLFDEDRAPEDLTENLSPADLEFLRRHGIRY